MAITNKALYKRMTEDAREFHKRMIKDNWKNHGMVWIKETDTGEMIVYTTKEYSEKLMKKIDKIFLEEIGG